MYLEIKRAFSIQNLLSRAYLIFATVFQMEQNSQVLLMEVFVPTKCFSNVLKLLKTLWYGKLIRGRFLKLMEI